MVCEHISFCYFFRNVCKLLCNFYVCLVDSLRILLLKDSSRNGESYNLRNEWQHMKCENLNQIFCLVNVLLCYRQMYNIHAIVWNEKVSLKVEPEGTNDCVCNSIFFFAISLNKHSYLFHYPLCRNGCSDFRLYHSTNTTKRTFVTPILVWKP